MARSTVFVVWVVLLLAGSRGVRGVPLRGHSGVIFGTEFLRILDDHVGAGSYDDGLEPTTPPLTRPETRPEDVTRDGVLVGSAGGRSADGRPPPLVEDGVESTPADRLSYRNSRRLDSGDSSSVASSLSSSSSVGEPGNVLAARRDKLPSLSDITETLKNASSSSTLTEDDYDYFLYYYYDLAELYEDGNGTTANATQGEGSLHPASTTTTTTTEQPPPSTTITTTTTTQSTPSTATTATTTQPPTTAARQRPPTTTASPPSRRTPSPAAKAPATARAFRYTTPGPKSRYKGPSRTRRPASPARLANKVGDARGRSSSSSLVVEVRVESPKGSDSTTTTTPSLSPRSAARTAQRPVEAAVESGRTSHLLTHPLVVQLQDDSPTTASTTQDRGPPASHTTTTQAPLTTNPTTTTTTTTITPAVTVSQTPSAGDGEVTGQSVVASVTRSEAGGGGSRQPRMGSLRAQQGMAPQGTAPFGHAPEGRSPFGKSPAGVVPQGVLPGGIHPQGVSPAGTEVLRLVDASVAAGGASSNNTVTGNHTVGYVVEENDKSRFRLEEKTPDGYIIGEYGVVDHQTGDVNGVRYTADSTADPRLIYDALMKFLEL